VNPLDFSDVQGLAKYGYRDLVQARYFLLAVRKRDAAAAWLVCAPVSTAVYQTTAPDTALQVAFTRGGLQVMGVADAVIQGFSTEFLQGMTEPSRSRRLGDSGQSDPEGWSWGGNVNVPHLVVMLFAKQNLTQLQASIQQPPWGDAFEILDTLDTSDMQLHEPFGFRDGISQPEFDWDRKQSIEKTTVDYKNLVALGELLLGYPNEYNKYTDRPLLDPSQDPENQLLPAEDNPQRRDLGRNGTYLVLRQMEQDVRGFWRYLDAVAAGDAAERYRLAAAMVGRTVDGAPLMTARTNSPANDFTYDADPSGTECPLGAHIRRANPRNADLVGHPAGLIAGGLNRLGIPRPKMRTDLIASTRFHRVLRRGREYGQGLTPEAALKPEPPDDAPRGLHFACLCANVSRQFEFVQNAWLMNTKFNGMTEESDPLLGNRAAVGDCPVTGNFSIPRNGQLARRLTRVPQFVSVRGGAYFFLPGIRALRYIAQAGTRNQSA
jgi:deferrochelatase/peroxidase EfeB